MRLRIESLVRVKEAASANEQEDKQTVYCVEKNASTLGPSEKSIILIQFFFA
jgi:hypothetical protein